MDIKKESTDENGDKTLAIASSAMDCFDMNLNGLLINNIYIPEEVLLKIFYYFDHKQLLKCHLVCKKWEFLIKKCVWRKKAFPYHPVISILWPSDDNLSWTSYYFICDKRPINKNLLEPKKFQRRINQRNIELIQFDKKNINLPMVLPFPEDPAFEGTIFGCRILGFFYQNDRARKVVIDLLKEGFTRHILDNVQPIIEISEWYCCLQEEKNANFNCTIKLLNEEEKIMRSFYYDKSLKDIDKRGKWINFTHKFDKYGKGLRKIKFYDGGRSEVIMAGACIKLVLPEFYSFNNE